MRSSSPGNGEAKAYDVRSVSRAVSVLAAFQDADELNLSELGRRLDLPKPTVFRIASTLEGEGLLKRTPDGAYCLGYRLVTLARLVLSRGLPQTARPYLEGLSRNFGFTVNLGVLSGGEVLFVDVIESRERFRVVPAIGSREALHATAIGKAIAAQLDNDTLQRILREHPLHAVTPRTIVARAKFEAALAAIREQGYAVDAGECHIGANCVGAAILDNHGVVGGLSVSATSDQLPSEDFPVVGDAVAAAARQISQALGTHAGTTSGGTAEGSRALPDKDRGDNMERAGAGRAA